MSARDWSAVAAILSDADRLLPHAGGGLSRLGGDLQAIDGLGLMEGSRLLGLQVDNLLDILSDCMSLRRAGVSTPDLEQAERDATALAQDMQARAMKILAARARDVAVHASVSLMDSDDLPAPENVTRDFRLLAAAPAARNSDDPGRIVPTPSIPAGDEFGRVSGRGWRAIVDLRNDSRAAPPGAIVLQPGHVIDLHEGENLVLYTEGVREGGRFAVPERDNCRGCLIEAGQGGLVLHGPAVVAPAWVSKGILARLSQDASGVMQHASRVCSSWSLLQRPVYKDEISSMMQHAIASAFMLGSSAILTMFIGQPLDENGRVIGAFLPILTAVFGVMAGAIALYKKLRIIPRFLRESRLAVRQVNAAIPPRVMQGETLADLHALLDSAWIFEDIAPMEKNGPEGPWWRIPDSLHKLLDEVVAFDGLNVHPARKMEIEAGQHPLVMQPLKALPAPGQEAISPCPDRIMALEAS